MSECIEWQGPRLKGKYGQVWAGGRMTYAHRWAWEQAHGPIPAGMQVLHRCDNPPCYNVEHLFLGTQLDNIRDMAAKGRRPDGERHWKTRLSAAQVAEIRARYVPGARNGQPPSNAQALADEFGVTRSSIASIVSGARWKVGAWSRRCWCGRCWWQWWWRPAGWKPVYRKRKPKPVEGPA